MVNLWQMHIEFMEIIPGYNLAFLSIGKINTIILE